MKYSLIIRELRNSADQNVRTFVRDVEGIKRLTVEERQYYLANLQETEALNMLVNDFIPYIIRVAYANSSKSNVLSVLDLVNEGILGTYKALNRNYRRDKDITRLVRAQIRNQIARTLVSQGGTTSTGINLKKKHHQQQGVVYVIYR